MLLTEERREGRGLVPSTRATAADFPHPGMVKGTPAWRRGSQEHLPDAGPSGKFTWWATLHAELLGAIHEAGIKLGQLHFETAKCSALPNTQMTYELTLKMEKNFNPENI